MEKRELEIKNYKKTALNNINKIFSKDHEIINKRINKRLEIEIKENEKIIKKHLSNKNY